METPLAISNYFINKANSLGAELTPMKLLKLVYLSHGWYLGLNNGEALIPEFAQAWEYGPVVQSVYDDFKVYQRAQITSLRSDKNTGNYPVVSDPETIKFLNRIWEVYGRYSGGQLSSITHQQGSPWFTVWNDKGGKTGRGVIIPNPLIAEYYKNKAAL